MMKSSLLIALVAILAVLMFNVAQADEAKLPGPDGVALWKYITETDPYTKWGQWDDFKGVQKSRSPHGPKVRVFVNKIGLEMKGPPAPYGMIEVKEALNNKGKIKNITVQYKVAEGYNPKGGDWFWAKYSPEGRVDAKGKVKGCIKCHKGSGKNDYITSHFFE
jgi:hypothetical protein